MNIDFDKKLLALCVSNSDLFTKSINDINPEHLKPHYKRIYQLLQNYYIKHKKLPSPEMLEKKLQDNRVKIFEGVKDPDEIILGLRTEAALSSPNDYDYIVEEIKDRASLSILNKAIPKAVELVKSEKDIHQATEVLQQAIAQIRSTLEKSIIKQTDSHNYPKELRDRYLQVKENPEISWGLKTGFDKLDEATFGLQGGEMLVVAARHGNGKSMWLLSACINMFRAGHNVTLISLEMPYKQYWNRFMACYADLPTDAIASGKLTPEQEKKYFAAIEELENAPNRFTIVDMPHTTISSIAAEVATIALQYAPEVLAVDYLGIVKAENTKLKDNEAQAAVVEELRAFGRVLNIPIMTAVQLNRDPGKSKTKTKGTERLSRSDIIGGTADLVVQIEEIDTEEAISRMTDRIKIFVIKNRKGKAPFDFEARKNFAHARFEDWDPIRSWNIGSVD